LPPRARALWDKVSKRDFSMGVDAGTTASGEPRDSLSYRVPANLDAVAARVETMELHRSRRELGPRLGHVNFVSRHPIKQGAYGGGALPLKSKVKPLWKREGLGLRELAECEEEAAVVRQEELRRVGEVAAEPEVGFVECSRDAQVACVQVEMVEIHAECLPRDDATAYPQEAERRIPYGDIARGFEAQQRGQTQSAPEERGPRARLTCTARPTRCTLQLGVDL